MKISDALASHTKLRYHQNCVSAADVLHETIIRPASRIDVMANAQLAQRRAENLHILEQIVRAVCYLAKQGLALRGNTEAESMATGGNPGNFLALLKEFAVDNKVLQDHLASPRVRNASYLSPQVQNEIISIMSNDIILPELISEVKESPFFSILADEVSSHNTEHLAVCLRFVDKACTLQEEFVAFVQLDHVRAADVAKALECVLQDVGLTLDNLRGQGYDGASTMSGSRNGVQAHLRERQPKALYTHCASHSLNLVITSSCKVPPIANCIAQIKDFTWWIKTSPKREGFLKEICRRETTDNRAFSLFNVCVTRWVENIDGWERFSTIHPFLVLLCEIIVYGNVEYPTDGEWSAEDKRNALAYLKVIESFDFIYSLVALQRTLL